MLIDTARIVRFWQAVETFNPRPLPTPDFRENITDVRGEDPLPWEEGSRFAGRQPSAGLVWRHQVFGGLFELATVRAALVGLYGGDDADGEAGGGGDASSLREQSALFACTVDAHGALIGRSAVSECAWALGRAVADGGDPAAWLTASPPGTAASGPDASTGLTGPKQDGLDDLDGGPPGRPLTSAGLRRFTAALAEHLGVATLLAPEGLRVRSYQVPTEATGEDGDPATRVLSSWFAADLARVASALSAHASGLQDAGDAGDAVGPGGAGPALADFLAGSEDIDWGLRVDVRDDPLVVRDGCAPERIPLGRWVTDAGHALVRSQQFAVNEIMARLGPGPGLFAVHAPPATGTAAMFSDLIAAIVVERARRLAELPAPRDAFAESHTWRAGPATHTVTAPVPALTGFEILLASAEHADIGGIGSRWADRAGHLDYFASTARLACGADAWGLIAAPLGDRAERRGFVERFWQGTVRGTDALFRVGEPMPAVLSRLAETASDWPAAVTSFREAMAKVNTLSSERTVASASIARFSALEDALEGAYFSVEAAQDRYAELARREATVSEDLAAAEERRRAAFADLEAHRADRPGLRAGLRAGREWHAAREKLSAAHDEAVLARDSALTQAQALRADLARARRAAAAAEEEVGTLTAQMAELQERVAQVRRRWGSHVPDGPSQEETEDAALIERREKSAAWADEEFTAARTELFLAALALHRALITAQAKTIGRNLAALMQILSGGGRPAREVALAAWQSFFLVVPVVSTTFAAVGSLLDDLGQGSLGWLLAQRAGQVPPQQVLGALWRADRAVLAGDPLQAPAESPLPWCGQQAVLKALEVDEEWAPARSCAQRVADRLARHGTWLPVEAPDGSGRLWVGTPLRVQRRSDRPILEACNDIAYDGLLVCGAPVRETFPGADGWYDVRPGAATGAHGHRVAGHWIPAEGEALLSLLTSLRAAGVPAAEVRVISPFRAVAAAAARVYCGVFGEVSAEELRTRVGTVHTVRAGDVVVLMLGGDPGRPDARAFASQTPNLLNSAIGRARRRLYIIGNRETWESQPYFDVLARRLTAAESAPANNSWTPRRNLAG
ncbi:MAG TPA: hypothetical protein VNV62_17640 [Trebonia sp.]|nr:hypothetical protein [Trebonia sp.]